MALCWAWRALEERKDAIAPSVAANSAESKLSAASGKSALSDSEPALPVMARMAALKARVRRATSQANSAAAPTLPNRMASFDKRVTYECIECMALSLTGERIGNDDGGGQPRQPYPQQRAGRGASQPTSKRQER